MGVPGTPKKGRRLGGDAAHQKAMFGNLVASLIAAEALEDGMRLSGAIWPAPACSGRRRDSAISRARTSSLARTRTVLPSMAHTYGGRWVTTASCGSRGGR